MNLDVIRIVNDVLFMLDGLTTSFPTTANQRSLFPADFYDDCHENEDAKEDENHGVPIPH